LPIIAGTKFKVAYDDVQKLMAGQVTELPAQVNAGLFGTDPSPYGSKDMYRKVVAGTHLMLDSGKFNFDDGVKAADVFPGIKPKTVKSMLEEAWKKA
jgi:hypothetical protein